MDSSATLYTDNTLKENLRVRNANRRQRMMLRDSGDDAVNVQSMDGRKVEPDIASESPSKSSWVPMEGSDDKESIAAESHRCVDTSLMLDRLRLDLDEIISNDADASYHHQSPSPPSENEWEVASVYACGETQTPTRRNPKAILMSGTTSLTSNADYSPNGMHHGKIKRTLN